MKSSFMFFLVLGIQACFIRMEAFSNSMEEQRLLGPYCSYTVGLMARTEKTHSLFTYFSKVVSIKANL